MEPAGRVLIPGRVALAAFVGHFACALAVSLRHPGLVYEPDRVANWLYFHALRTGAPRLADFWYFPAPKVTAVVLLGPLADGPLEGVVVAAVAGLLGAALAWLAARSFGAAAGVGTALLVPLDPLWTILVATASADLLVAAGVAGAVAAWVAERPRLAGVALLLATAVKAPAAAAALPLVLTPGTSLRARAWPVIGAAAGFVATLGGYVLLLGSTQAPFGFLAAYTEMRGTAPPPLVGWLARWAATDLFGEMLRWSWPLALVGLGATLVARDAWPMRLWSAAALAVGAAFVALAVATDTLLFARFLWAIELCVVAWCAIGAAVVGRVSARRLLAGRGLAQSHEERGALVAPAATALLLLVAAISLWRGAGGSSEHYAVLFEAGARTALPWLERAAPDVRPAQRVLVPLWFQPAAMWLLRDADVAAAEVEVARPREQGGAADWLLLAPAYYETRAAAAWSTEATRAGYDVVATSTLPRMALLRRSGASTSQDPVADARP